jgi:TatD DNase family protein
MAGIHPWDVEKELCMPNFKDCDIVGETGLDYLTKVDKECQKRIFIEHLRVAQELDKPVVIHNVKATDDILHILSQFPTIKGIVFHGYIGSKQQAEILLKRGYYLSFGHRSLRSPKTREVIATMDIGRLFCETDDEPNISIAEIYTEVATLRNITTKELLDEIEKNYNILFDKD